MQIYLDYSATTPMRTEAIATLTQALTEQWGNPSSLHGWGQRAALAMETARLQVAGLIGGGAEGIVFTGSGTEADNLAVMGIAQRYERPQHLIISSVEHSAIAKPAQWLEQQGWAVTRLGVDHFGQVDPAELKAAIRPDTVLISIIWGQSEVGTVQPIAELGQIAREAGVPFHCDAVQVAGRLPIDLATLPIDMLSLSSHKLYGPQGVGALYVRPGVRLEPLVRGGGQEQGLRAGTQGVGAIAAFGTAAELAAQELGTEIPRLQKLQSQLIDRLSRIPGLSLTGHPTERLPHHISFCLSDGLADDLTDDLAKRGGRKLVYSLGRAGIAISAGSACNSGQSVPSKVLKAMGYSDAQALSASRLTLGKPTTEAEVEQAVDMLKQLLLIQGAVAGA